MANNSELSIDDLIKRIYKSYIDIKVGEFREIDRDLLLSDIGLLYTSIKDLYPSNNIPIIELDLAAASKKEEIENMDEDTTTESIDIQLGQDSELEGSEFENKIEKTKEEVIVKHSAEQKIVELDISMCEDNRDLEENIQEKPISLLDKKSDNTSSRILNEYKVQAPDANVEVVKIDATSPSVKIAETDPRRDNASNTEDTIIQEEILEPEKKNANNIIDFLHHNEKKEIRDIYSFLDINTRIGLVELFFKSNSLELTECLVKLNKLTDREECIKVINKFAAIFGVEETEDIYKQFVNLIDRKLKYNT
jgi:hypothetical protein